MFQQTSRRFVLALAFAALLTSSANMTAQSGGSGVVSGGDPQPTGKVISAISIILTTLYTM